MKILLIGSLPPPLGGTTVSFKTLIDGLNKNNVNATVVNTISIRGKTVKGIIKLFYVIGNIIANFLKNDIVTIHLNDAPFAYLGIFFIIICKAFKKPLIVRKFGGNEFNLGLLGNFLANKVMKHADICLLETKALIKYAEQNNIKNVFWFPNNRPRLQMDCDFKTKERCNNFVYIGHVKKEKGIIELIQASEDMPENINVHVYGPFTKDLSESVFEGKKRIKYCGIIQPEQVISVLMNYDAFVFPTYNKKEGYAGAIIEAYYAGLPIVCTNWQALSEIVDSSTGILIPPGNHNALFEAMYQLSNDSELYNKLRIGVLNRSKEFDSEFWNKKFIDYCLYALNSKIT